MRTPARALCLSHKDPIPLEAINFDNVTYVTDVTGRAYVERCEEAEANFYMYPSPPHHPPVYPSLNPITLLCAEIGFSSYFAQCSGPGPIIANLAKGSTGKKKKVEKEDLTIPATA